MFFFSLVSEYYQNYWNIYAFLRRGSAKTRATGFLFRIFF